MTELVESSSMKPTSAILLIGAAMVASASRASAAMPLSPSDMTAALEIVSGVGVMYPGSDGDNPRNCPARQRRITFSR